MKRLALKLFSTNRELVNFVRKNAHLDSPINRRARVKIAVIDDEPFAPHTNLIAYGYSIDVLGDIKKIDEVVDFHLVLCDVMGVGRHFDTKNQGASLIEEIKKAYPEKIVIAYTGAALNNPAARKAIDRADDYLKKDSDIERWINVLDRTSGQALDPFQIWERYRKRFVQLEVPTDIILLLEDSYVKDVLDGNSKFPRLKSTLNMPGIQGDVKKVVQSIGSRILYRLILDSAAA